MDFSRAIFEQGITVFQVGASGTDGLDFRAGQHDAGFQFIFQKVIVARGAIYRGIALAGCYGIALDVFGLRCRLGAFGFRVAAHRGLDAEGLFRDYASLVC